MALLSKLIEMNHAKREARLDPYNAWWGIRSRVFRINSWVQDLLVLERCEDKEN